MAPHSRTLAWKIPWTEELGRLQSMGSLRVGHDWATSLSLSCIGEGNGNPLQCSCLENPGDGKPGGLPSMGSHRVGHDWSDAAAAVFIKALYREMDMIWKKTCECLRRFIFILLYFSWTYICQNLDVREKQAVKCLYNLMIHTISINSSLIDSWNVAGRHVFLPRTSGNIYKDKHFAIVVRVLINIK